MLVVVVFSCIIQTVFSYILRALGFAATRGKLYYRHPELFKVNHLSDCQGTSKLNRPNLVCCVKLRLPVHDLTANKINVNKCTCWL